MNTNKEIANAINDKILKYVTHKSKVIGERVYWACIDKVFEAQQYEEYDMDSSNNIYVSYNLKKEENIINQPHDSITCQIISDYRKNLKIRLANEGFYISYNDDEIRIFFSQPIMDDDFEIDNEDSETNINKYIN
jgi:dTDP-4-dehydrorhamnose reductase